MQLARTAAETSFTSALYSALIPSSCSISGSSMIVVWWASGPAGVSLSTATPHVVKPVCDVAALYENERSVVSLRYYQGSYYVLKLRLPMK